MRLSKHPMLRTKRDAPPGNTLYKIESGRDERVFTTIDTSWLSKANWIPAYAGMTELIIGGRS